THDHRARAVVPLRAVEVVDRAVDAEAIASEAVLVEHHDVAAAGAVPGAGRRLRWRHRTRGRRRAMGAADRTRRRYAIVETHRAEIGIAARAQRHAVAAVAGVRADLPGTAMDDHRRRAIVETEALEVADRAVLREIGAAEAVALIEGHRLRGGACRDRRE